MLEEQAGIEEGARRVEFSGSDGEGKGFLRFQISDLRFEISDFRFKTSDLRFEI
jgi:hypothetical protein